METTAQDVNPFLDIGPTIRFDRMKPAHVEPAIMALIERAQANIDAIGAVSEVTYENTFGALDTASTDLEMAYGLVNHLEAVTEDPALRAAYNAVQPEISRFFSSIALNGDLYRALRAFSESEEAKTVDATRARFVTKTLDDFRRHGAELNEADKARLTRDLAEAESEVLDRESNERMLSSDESKLLAAAKGLKRPPFWLEQHGNLARRWEVPETEEEFEKAFDVSFPGAPSPPRAPSALSALATLFL